MTKRSYFSAAFQCQHCGSYQTPDCCGGIPSGLLDRWVSDTVAPNPLRVGDAVDVSQQDFAQTYVTMRPPPSEMLTHLLDSWTCPVCDEDNWVEIVFDHYLISCIETVPPSRSVLERTHYIAHHVYRDALCDAGGCGAGR